MARPLRLAFEDAVYHITVRGNRREDIFYTDNDRSVFLEKVNEAFNKYSFICYAYCLMDNHYHLFVKTPHANISKGMHYLNASYTNWFKAEHYITGVIFQGRYKSILVDEDSYALQLSAYIHLNPVRAGLVDDPGKYGWSSFQDYTRNKKPSIENLDTDFLLEQFDVDPVKARRKYSRFVRNNKDMENPLEDSFRGVALGSEKYIEKIKKLIDKSGKKREVSATRITDTFTPEDIMEVISGKFKIDRKEVFKKKRGNIYRPLALYFIKKKTELGLKELGNLFDMDYTAVSQACRRFEQMAMKDRNIDKVKQRVEKELRGKKNKI